MDLLDLKKKQHIAILWYGLEGQSTYRFLRAHGVTKEAITILDKNPTISTPSGITTSLWANYLVWLERFDCIFRAPGITTTIIENTLWKRIWTSNFTSQTEFFLNNFSWTIIGITWTKGKSTISTLTYLTLKHAKKNVLLAGNVGKPILDLIDRDNLPQIVVYELSSFMIESVFTQRKGRKIDIAVFNTLYNTHTKEHGWYENYARTKCLLLNYSKTQLLWSQAKSILNEQFADIMLPWTTRTYGKEGVYTWDGTYFQINKKNLFTDEWMSIIWTHNRENACAVIGICDLLDIAYTHLQSVLQAFSWLEHRLEYIGKYNNIYRYNDAIATTPEATCAALDSFWSKIDTLFYGWIQGEYNHHLVAEKIMHYGIRNLVLFPDTWELLFDMLDETVKKNIKVLHTRSMADGVHRANKNTKAGHIALLSCGSPSFSVWTWFVEKWSLFKETVHSLK
jgi:UDP-N-acetylmuramoyl-L-alanine---L-glutamate ligase